MALPIEIDSEARWEFDEAFDWYAARSTGAALGFAAEVEAAIEKIARDPGRFPKTFADCQRCSLERYPYCVVFFRHEDKIRVVAIAHLKRRPGYWRRRK